jgi:hypothetical protein
LYCAFVDFEKAFNNIWRVALWNKLLLNKINGKMNNFIVNMYNSIKSCIVYNDNKSDFFSSEVQKIFSKVCNPSEVSDIRTVSSAYKRANILKYIVTEFNYLGVTLTKNGKFKLANQKNIEKATKTMYEVIRRGKDIIFKIQIIFEPPF